MANIRKIWKSDFRKVKATKIKIKGKKIEINTGESVELEEADFIQIIVPQSDGRTSVHLAVINGKLEISGGASIIDSINGPGMSEKVRA